MIYNDLISYQYILLNIKNDGGKTIDGYCKKKKMYIVF